MLRIVLANKILFAGYLLIFFISFFLLSWHGKSQTHILLTGYHTPFTDWVMQVITWLGDGLFMILVGSVMLFRNIRIGISILISFLFSSLIVQLLKRFIFSDYKRPVAWFNDLGIEIYRIPGLEYHSSMSFPSGHSTTAFALFFGLAFIVKNKGLKILFLMLAVITAYSRVYLSQHFLGDAIAGSLIGVITALTIYSFFEKREEGWFNKNLYSILRRKND